MNFTGSIADNMCRINEFGGHFEYMKVTEVIYRTYIANSLTLTEKKTYQVSRKPISPIKHCPHSHKTLLFALFGKYAFSLSSEGLTICT